MKSHIFSEDLGIWSDLIGWNGDHMILEWDFMPQQMLKVYWP